MVQCPLLGIPRVTQGDDPLPCPRFSARAREIAFWAAIACSIAAGIMLILTILGYLHLRRVPDTEEL